MDKVTALAVLMLGVLAFVAAEPLEAGWCPSPGAGGSSGGGARPGGTGISGGGGGASGGRGTGGTIYSTSDFGGSIQWIDSLGQTTPVLTASDKGVAKGDNDAAIFELKKACEEMKPILVFFSKPKDLLAFGAKAQKDPEVDACTALDEDLWKRIAITERAKEFVCVRVNIRKADPRLLARYRVARAPVIEILDFNLRELHFSASPKVNYSPFGRIMETAQKTVEADVKKLAAKTDDTSDVKAAKQRALVLEQREICKQGLDLLDKKKWDDAEAKFKKAVETGPDSAWKNEAKVGLIEVKAGKMLDDAEKLYDNKRFKECKELCEKILKECREARFFTASVQELKTKVEKKLS